MKIHWISVVFLVSLTLDGCSPSRPIVEDSPSAAPTNATAAVSLASVTTPTITEVGAWKTYHNIQAGYSMQYLEDWTVSESTATGGELVTTFKAPIGGQFILVSVVNSDAVVEEIPDMPNTRCEPVTINGLSGRRCFDTLAFSYSTTILSHDKQYTIASSGKHIDRDIYQQFLESFAVTP